MSRLARRDVLDADTPSSITGAFKYCDGALSNMADNCHGSPHRVWSYDGESYDCVGYYSHDDGFCGGAGTIDGDDEGKHAAGRGDLCL
jgi:hypothetical protein